MRQSAAGSERSKHGLSCHWPPARHRHPVEPSRERDAILIEKELVLIIACNTDELEDLREAYDMR